MFRNGIVANTSVLVDAGLVLLTPVSPAGFAGGSTTDRSVCPLRRNRLVAILAGDQLKPSRSSTYQFHSFHVFLLSALNVHRAG